MFGRISVFADKNEVDTKENERLSNSNEMIPFEGFGHVLGSQIRIMNSLEDYCFMRTLENADLWGLLRDMATNKNDCVYVKLNIPGDTKQKMYVHKHIISSIDITVDTNDVNVVRTVSCEEIEKTLQSSFMYAKLDDLLDYCEAEDFYRWYFANELTLYGFSEDYSEVITLKMLTSLFRYPKEGVHISFKELPKVLKLLKYYKDKGVSEGTIAYAILPEILQQVYLDS
ncbi:hypothetical protein [Acetivibrio ethanolgignens]|uniref:Uncharacterized protein n=1 Tax=Acetivibrio ethanolgignens TaxID=290052 RepID=A0A0V8QDX5_9FIRM|nr:hypothetical protein [Acetivibrio ethanolgignens]KSV58754.1 hypothetical protein ASU35_11870 [Acetivibrio ethanolgignens]